MRLELKLENHTLVIGLGVAGLIPFLASASWAISERINYIPIIGFCYYSAGILCFLAGTLWRHRGQKTSLMLQSNAITLLAVLALILFHVSYYYTLYLLLIGFSWILYLDCRKTDYDAWYKQFRLAISAVVLLLHSLLLALV